MTHVDRLEIWTCPGQNDKLSTEEGWKDERSKGHRELHLHATRRWGSSERRERDVVHRKTSVDVFESFGLRV